MVVVNVVTTKGIVSGTVDMIKMFEVTSIRVIEDFKETSEDVPGQIDDIGVQNLRGIPAVPTEQSSVPNEKRQLREQ